MSQAPASNPVARPQSTGDAPDILFVLRHYRWLIIIGSLLGLVVGMALYVSLRIARPQYSGSMTFLVQPPPNILQNVQGGAVPASAEETGRFIRLQMSLLANDDFVDGQILKQTDIVSTRWYALAKGRAKMALRSAMVITPVAGTDLFKVTMTIPQREEVAVILNAIASVYLKEVENRNNRDIEESTRNLSEARSSQEAEVARKRASLEEYKVKHDINTMASTQSISLAALGSLYTELTRMQIEYVSAEKQVKSIMDEVQKPDYKLPLELQQQMVDGDPVVRSLDNDRLALERELDVSLKSYSPDHPVVKNIRNRIEAVNKQLKEIRDDLTAKVKTRQVANAQSSLSGLSERMTEIKRRHDAKQDEIRDLDRYLSKFRQMEVDASKSDDLLRDIDNRLQIEKLKQSVPVIRVKQWQKASEPKADEMTSPTMATYLPTGFAAGLVISFALAYLLELTNTRVRTPRDITRNLQLPLLGFVPDQIDDDLLTGDLSTSIRTSPSSMIAESFRQIRGRVTAHSETPPRTILVSSISPGGGATTVASNLANGLALNGRRVLLVDANFYRPGISAIYPNLPAVGFSDVLTDPSKVDSSIAVSPDLPSLSIMGPGSMAASASAQLLDSNICRDVIERLKSKYDMVILDGAPLSLVSDSLSLAAKVDGVIAVVRAGRITRGTVARVREQLRQVRAQLLGVVLNAAQTQSAGYFKENYQTFYRYAQANGHPQPVRQPAGHV